jgi:hypothetical protein
MANVINKRFVYSNPGEAIGDATDDPATDVDGPQTLISLLKAILETGAMVPAQLVNHQIIPRMADLERRLKALEDKAT